MNYSISELVAAIAASEGPARVRGAGRLMTALVERSDAELELVAVLQCSVLPRPATVIGFTGAPGAGKSTLVDAAVTRLLQRRPDVRIAVIAVDPTSPFTGGAVLGDRVRMMRLALEPRVFIRSLATRGELGGVCRALPGVLAAAALWARKSHWSKQWASAKAKSKLLAMPIGPASWWPLASATASNGSKPA
ncbi:MAG: hypothetical protein QM775_35645 [Pirellulales bacterium]